MIRCVVCEADVADTRALAEHFLARADASDVRHVMWLNRHVGLRELRGNDLRLALERVVRRQR